MRLTEVAFKPNKTIHKALQVEGRGEFGATERSNRTFDGLGMGR